MSIKTRTTPGGAKTDPGGATIISAGEGGPRSMQCPQHRLACTLQTTEKGTVFVCPRGCRLRSSPLRG